MSVLSLGSSINDVMPEGGGGRGGRGGRGRMTNNVEGCIKKAGGGGVKNAPK